MSMSPEEKMEFDELKRIVRNLQGVTDVPFIESAKKRIAEPLLGDNISLFTTGDTTNLLQAVNEGGSSSYSVAEEYAGSLTIEDKLGNRYKLGYYTA